MSIRRIIGVVNILLGISIVTVLVVALVFGQQNIFGLNKGPGGGEIINVSSDATNGREKSGDDELTEIVRTTSDESSGVTWRTTKPSAPSQADSGVTRQSQSTNKYGASAPSTTRTAQNGATQNGAADRTTAGANASSAGANASSAGANASSAGTSGSRTPGSTTASTPSPTERSSETTAQTTAKPTETTSGTTSGAPVAATSGAPETTTANAAETDAPEYDYTILAGKIICIDPGHQRKQNNELEQIAPDSGVKKPKVSSGTAGISTGEAEYVLNLAVALKLKNLLEISGATVVMTRVDHDVDISNIERAKIGNDANADLVVRIHADGSTNRETKGITVLIPSAKYVGEVLAETSKRAGQAVLDAVIAATGAKNRGLSVREDMTGFNWSTVPVALIEMGFMSNPDEDKLLATDEYRAKLASGLYNGCVAYFSGQ